MNDQQINELIAFLVFAIPAVYRLMKALRTSTPFATLQRHEEKVAEQKTANGNGNGNGVYAAQRQTIDFLGKRQDDILEELREFKAEIRDEIRESSREMRADTKKRHDDFVELARRRDDGWILQFGDFSRQYRHDGERRDAERKEMQEQISSLRDDFSNLQTAFAELKETIDKRIA
jgi:predicted  nucleic acid-binding Zn-ribbon protein